MRRCAVLGVLILALLFLVERVALTQATGQRVIVGPNVRVSSSLAGRAHHEVVIGTSMTDVRTMVACAMVQPTRPSSRRYDVVTYVSEDAGQSWRHVLTLDDGDRGHMDPSCLIDPMGRLFIATIRGDRELGRSGSDEKSGSRIRLYQADGPQGKWSLQRELTAFDRPFLTAIPSGGLYLHANGWTRDTAGQQIPAVVVFREDPSSGPNALPAVVPTAQGLQPNGVGNGVVLPDDRLLFAYLALQLDESRRNAAPIGTIMAFATEKEGVGVAQAVKIADANRQANGAMLPSTAVDRSGGLFDRTAYVAWIDYREGGPVPLVSRSVDGGSHWSPPVVVEPVTPQCTAAGRGVDRQLPMIAVNRDGVVGVQWYEQRLPGEGYRLRFAASWDGADSFGESVPVSEQPHIERLWSDSLDGVVVGGGSEVARYRGPTIQLRIRSDDWLGHTAGLTATADGAFRPLWVDNRTGVAQVWTARVDVTGKAHHHGHATLDGFTDVTSQLNLQWGTMTADKQTGTLEAELIASNTSDRPVTGRLIARLVSARSLAGSVRIHTADGERAASETLIDFTDALDAGVLKPGERSKAKRIRVSIKADCSPDPVVIDDAGRLLLELGVRFYAKRPGLEPVSRSRARTEVVLAHAFRRPNLQSEENLSTGISDCAQNCAHSQWKMGSIGTTWRRTKTAFNCLNVLKKVARYESR